jgi:2-amino-4-hydroxy-6-hydroxymethyldihydropteridine diphosphokinase
MPHVVAYLGLGSNLGDRMAALREAVDRLRALPAVNILRLSPVYETEPVGVGETPQPTYLNAVAEAETSLTARGLLEAALEIENAMGRRRTIRWGPRVIDIDVLLYGDAAIDEPGLTVPHPRMRERGFVLTPLSDLAPDLVPAGTHESIRMLRECTGSQSVRGLGSGETI